MQALHDETDAVEPAHLFDRVNIYADVCTNYKGSDSTFVQMCEAIAAAGCIPKVQLFSPQTFNREWPLPEVWVPSVFQPADVEWAAQRKPLALKVASVESTYWELLSVCMETKLPLIVSTGGMDSDELLQLLEHVEEYSGNVCLMHCISKYPAQYHEANILRIATLVDAMEDMLMTPYVGWSSHHYERITLKLLPLALAYGADQIEVHVKPTAYGDLSEAALANETPDEQCAVPIDWLSLLRGKCSFVADALGSDEEETPADREQVLEWRHRWQDEALHQ